MHSPHERLTPSSVSPLDQSEVIRDACEEGSQPGRLENRRSHGAYSRPSRCDHTGPTPAISSNCRSGSGKVPASRFLS